MPPFLRRCPDCGHVATTGRFRSSDAHHVVCPACDHEFDALERPWYA